MLMETQIDGNQGSWSDGFYISTFSEELDTLNAKHLYTQKRQLCAFLTIPGTCALACCREETLSPTPKTALPRDTKMGDHVSSGGPASKKGM